MLTFVALQRKNTRCPRGVLTRSQEVHTSCFFSRTSQRLRVSGRWFERGTKTEEEKESGLCKARNDIDMSLQFKSPAISFLSEPHDTHVADTKYWAEAIVIHSQQCVAETEIALCFLF